MVGVKNFKDNVVVVGKRSATTFSKKIVMDTFITYEDVVNSYNKISGEFVPFILFNVPKGFVLTRIFVLILKPFSGLFSSSSMRIRQLRGGFDLMARVDLSRTGNYDDLRISEYRFFPTGAPIVGVFDGEFSDKQGKAWIMIEGFVREREEGETIETPSKIDGYGWIPYKQWWDTAENLGATWDDVPHGGWIPSPEEEGAEGSSEGEAAGAGGGSNKFDSETEDVSANSEGNEEKTSDNNAESEEENSNGGGFFNWGN